VAEVRDIAPGLLEAIMEDFNRLIAEDGEVEYIVENGRAYVDAHHYADRVGEHLAEAFRNNISSGVLPDGKMYYNIAERTIRPAIENGRLLINGMSGLVQETLNEAAGIGLRAITPAPDTQRVDGIINRLASEDSFDNVAWLLDEPVKTLSRSFVDDYIKANADFHAKSGLSPRISRTSTGDCCKWCSRIAGSYDYGSASMPRDIFRRHNRCRCMVLYDPVDGRGYQDSHSKQWYDSEETARIEQRKRVGENAVAASPVFINKSDRLHHNAAKVKPIPGYEDIAVHGSPTGFAFGNADGVESNVSVLEFAHILKGSGVWHGGNIRLLSCGTGAEGAIAAQGLADYLGVEVIAPSDTLWIDDEGNMTIGPTRKFNIGEWRSFKPKEGKKI